MSTRISWLVILVGAVLLVFGLMVGLALRDYTIFSLPVTSQRDLVISAVVALTGLTVIFLGLRGIRRGKRTGETSGAPGETHYS